MNLYFLIVSILLVGFIISLLAIYLPKAWKTQKEFVIAFLVGGVIVLPFWYVSIITFKTGLDWVYPIGFKFVMTFR